MPVRRKNSVRSRTDPSFSEAFVTVRLDNNDRAKSRHSTTESGIEIFW